MAAITTALPNTKTVAHASKTTARVASKNKNKNNTLKAVTDYLDILAFLDELMASFAVEDEAEADITAAATSATDEEGQGEEEGKEVEEEGKGEEEA